MTRFRKQPNESGAVAVEFALLLPFLLLIVVGLIEFGRGYNAKISLTHAAREGARALAVGKPIADVQSTIVNAADGIDTSKLSISGLTACSPGSTATITLNYPLSYSIPFWTNGSWDIDAKGTMRCGG